MTPDNPATLAPTVEPTATPANPRPDLARHPCFNEDARCSSARVHLPVAPRCNVQCNFCNRDFSCANESRPGVTSAVLKPAQALERLREIAGKLPSLSVAGIAGPGDPFANPVETLETLRLIRQEWPGMILCVATNGLNLLPYVDELAALQVSHVTLTVNAVDPAIGQHIYAWLRYGKGTHRGEEAAAWLWEQQRQSILALKARGIIVKINSIAIPGKNMDHLETIGRTVAALGADVINIIPLIPVAGTAFGDLPAPASADTARVKQALDGVIKQMGHCQRCRADAIGLLGKDQTMEDIRALQSCHTGGNKQLAAGAAASHPAPASPLAATDPARPAAPLDAATGQASLAPDAPGSSLRVAVASMEGLLINQHLGEAMEVLVYETGSSGSRLLGSRSCPPPGGGDQRWKDLALLIADCRYILVNGVGPRPQAVLEESGIGVLVLEGLVGDALASLGKGDIPERMIKQEAFSCGSSCSGTGGGCG